MSRRALAVSAVASLLLVTSCDENLPFGPDTFSASVSIVSQRDTIVVGDSGVMTARAVDAQGRVVQGLTYTWTSADTNIISLSPANSTNPDAVAGRTRTLIAKRPGRSNLTMSLPDSRFVTSSAVRTGTSVVGGIRVLTTRDTTLTSINDTAVAIAAGLVRVGATMVTRPSLGVKWTQRGNRTQIVGTGDTIRYISRANGVDTLIATHDFCLAGQKCADTVIARVSQALSLGLSTRNFQAWSFSDSVGPTIVLADRRGVGQFGTSVRFVPRTAQDSNLVKIVGPFGGSNPANGAMAAPKAVTAGNGTARVLVQGLAPDGQTVVAIDSISVVIRQVARRIAAEAQRATVTFVDSIPVRGFARDARGAVIADATVDLTSLGIPLSATGWAGPTNSPAVQGTLIPSLTGIALPSNNPAAPQIPVSVDVGLIFLTDVDTVKADVAQVAVSVLVVDSLAQVANGKWVRFFASGASTPDSVQSGVDGVATVVWSLPTTAGTYTLTGVRGTPTPMLTVADSAGRVVIRQKVEVIAANPTTAQTTAVMSATNIAQNGVATLTVTARDQFQNVVKDVLPSVFTVTLTGTGTLGPLACNQGICTATYTAPNAAANPSITVQITGVNVVGSPINLIVP